MTATTFTAEQLKGIAQVEKLMALAAGNANEHEAAAATERASFILAKLNLDMEALTQSTGKDTSERKDDKMVGGFYQHERDMWRAISELNFCFYSTVKVRYHGEDIKKHGRNYAHHHRLIGRTVNIVASRIMADYLLKTIERLVREFCERDRPMEKFHPRSSTAISYRKGAAQRLIEKINDRRREVLREEARKEAEMAKAGASGGKGLMVITNLVASEFAANFDVRYGDGAWARAQARDAAWEAQFRREEAAYQQRLANDPAFAKAEAKRIAEEQRKADARWERQRNRAAPKFKGDASAFIAGFHDADAIGLDQQVGHTQQGRLG